MAVIDVVLHGVPNGEDTSKCDDATRNFLGLFYTNSKGIQTKVSRCQNNDVFYTYLVYQNPNAAFVDYNGRPGSYFGISLVFHNQYASDSNTVFKLLQNVYDNYVKNKIIQEMPNGSRKWLYPQLSTPKDEIAEYVCNGMTVILQKHPELKFKTLPLSPIQNQTQRD